MARSLISPCFDPVLLTKNSRPSHVVLSANDYNALIRQLEILEDKIWGERTLEAKRTGKFMGPEKFMKWLKDTEARLEREIADAEA